mmetsp:Transcript_35604/g.72564  ORF Transcript_35604/g.72564 Transcript_35604/m.72564 type:complete len:317 (+) Transcript_35604:81-1031(+)
MRNFLLWAIAVLALVNPTTIFVAGKTKKKKKGKTKVPSKSTRDRDVSPLCHACEQTGFHAHGIITAKPASYPSRDKWATSLTEGCASNTKGSGGGCNAFLTELNVKTVVDELFEMSQEGADSDVVDLSLDKMQELLCFELTDSCPDGSRGTVRHVFPPAKNDFSVSLTLISKLDKGLVKVFWIDPAVGDAQEPGDRAETIAPGSTQHHKTFRGHRFRLLGPGAAWDDPWSRVDLTLHRGRDQAYMLVRNATYELGLPLEVAEFQVPGFRELPPPTWNEEEDGLWAPPLVPNPRLATNRMYYLREVDPVTMAFEDEL